MTRVYISPKDLLYLPPVLEVINLLKRPVELIETPSVVSHKTHRYLIRNKEEDHISGIYLTDTVIIKKD